MAILTNEETLWRTTDGEHRWVLDPNYRPVVMMRKDEAIELVDWMNDLPAERRAQLHKLISSS